MSTLFVRDASVLLPIYNSSSRSFAKSLLTAATGGLISTQGDKHVSIEALKNLNLEIVSGDRLGVLGHNGSGKSTLLRLLSGIYEPSSGEIKRDGSISSMVDINLGINHEITGRENIFLRGRLMGVSKKSMNSQIDDIIEFSGLGDYIDLPVRVYSSGMILRLAFTVATSVNADILIMDEWLSMGDGEFAKTASLRLSKIVDNAEILVLASHNRALLERTCTQTVWLEHGRIRKIGPTQEITQEYFV